MAYLMAMVGLHSWGDEEPLPTSPVPWRWARPMSFTHKEVMGKKKKPKPRPRPKPKGGY